MLDDGGDVMGEELKPCPFCGGNGSVTFHELQFRRRGETKEHRYGVKVVCGRCNARGPLVATDWTRFNPYLSYEKGRFAPCIGEAIDAWNRREGDAS